VALDLFDIGGGSSEIAVIDLPGERSGRLANHIRAWTSLPVGVVTLSERFGGRERTAGKPVGERLSLDELHHQEMTAVVLVHAVEGADVRVVQRSQRLGFALEASNAIDVGRDGLRQHLDSDIAPEFRVAGAIHLAHSAGTDRDVDDIGAKSCSRSEGHEGGSGPEAAPRRL